MHSIREPVVIPWAALEAQFGAAYGATRDFRVKFLRRLKDVLIVYPRARITEVPGQGLQLAPSLTSIPSAARQRRP